MGAAKAQIARDRLHTAAARDNTLAAQADSFALAGIDGQPGSLAPGKRDALADIAGRAGTRVLGEIAGHYCKEARGDTGRRGGKSPRLGRTACSGKPPRSGMPARSGRSFGRAGTAARMGRGAQKAKPGLGDMAHRSGMTASRSPAARRGTQALHGTARQVSTPGHDDTVPAAAPGGLDESERLGTAGPARSAAVESGALEWVLAAAAAAVVPHCSCQDRRRVPWIQKVAFGTAVRRASAWLPTHS
mmetsp:Transcript_15042/g.31916  ORF Transcript_15042/g.31916 Transcript_15042/m.31916 type:complete len:246 (+) Transcript_15042:171-908(+)